MTDAALADDRMLVARAADGCGESFSALVTRHRDGVVHYVRRLLGPAGGSEDDLAQETFLAAFRQLDRYDDSFAFCTWLFTIARHACLNHQRSSRRRVKRETERTRSRPVSDVVSPDRFVAACEEREQLWELARRTLPEKQFSALWLHYAEDMPVAEIGRILGRPTTTVRVLLFRARRALAGGFIAAIAVALIAAPATVHSPEVSSRGGIEKATFAVDSGIERVPTPGEIGEGVVVSLAAALVDLPPWLAVVTTDPSAFMADEFRTSDGTP